MKDLILFYNSDGKETIFPVNRPLMWVVDIFEGFLVIRFEESDGNGTLTMPITYQVEPDIEDIIQNEDTDFYDRAVPEIHKTVREYLMACLELEQKIIDLNLLEALLVPILTELASQAVQHRLDNPKIEPDIPVESGDSNPSLSSVSN